MLRLSDKNINLNGQSIIDDNVVASMNANYSGDIVYTNFNIESPSLFELHKADVLADWEEFIDEAMEFTK